MSPLDKLNGINGKIRLADILIAIFTAGVLSLNAFMLSSIIELREFAAKGDRFTATDAQILRKEIVSDITHRLPPKWLVDRVELLGENQKSLCNRLITCGKGG